MKHTTIATCASIALSVTSAHCVEAQSARAADSSAFAAIARSAVHDSGYTRAGPVLVDPRTILIPDIGDASSVAIDTTVPISLRRGVLTRAHIAAGDATWPKRCPGVMAPDDSSRPHRACPRNTTTVVAMARPVRGDTAPDTRTVNCVAMASGPEGASRLVMQYTLRAFNGPWQVVRKKLVSFAE